MLNHGWGYAGSETGMLQEREYDELNKFVGIFSAVNSMIQMMRCTIYGSVLSSLPLIYFSELSVRYVTIRPFRFVQTLSRYSSTLDIKI